MKVLHLSTSDIDGGAARAVNRLHHGLRQAGVTSQMLVRAKQSSDVSVLAERSLLTKIGPQLNSLPLRCYRNREQFMFSPQWLADTIAPRVKQLEPDIVHIHWICNGFLKIETLRKLNKPLVWTLHDMWPLTGGCHYTRDCRKYLNKCGECPQLRSAKEHDLSRQIWKRKANAWKSLDLTLIAPSQWIADCARESSLFQNNHIEVIPHGLNLDKFRPIEQQVARKLLNLPADCYSILFGASSGVIDDPRKGFKFLQKALKSLADSGWRERLNVLIFGINQPEQPLDLGVQPYYLGRLTDDLMLALAYSSADVMVVPSIQETFGQTASEALACGTPVVAFGATGPKDIVAHLKDGYLAKPFNITDLAKGILWILEDQDRHTHLRKTARERAKELLSLKLQVHRHEQLYRGLLE